ncbi:jg1181 [Pararge aegeria aegeria]|uniref:Jg1181 protein n=1 Tax=Pararge aegeria aegeria TaxID=348720 RepID=A0A8S4QD02_9NEOP|nr:jg1181 [Pararge aegeria aegeria]
MSPFAPRAVFRVRGRSTLRMQRADRATGPGYEGGDSGERTSGGRGVLGVSRRRHEWTEVRRCRMTTATARHVGRCKQTNKTIGVLPASQRHYHYLPESIFQKLRQLFQTDTEPITIAQHLFHFASRRFNFRSLNTRKSKNLG